ncbi:MAG: DUF2461 domain-containing protein [candidate division Zixibacteria bacterium]|nr:DUF2461 domain-containing protein [candidate division Zixibacteria bacterium]
MPKSEFDGFPKECIRFYKGLKKNNTKLWFEEHRGEFDNYVMTPARIFVGEMGARLKKLSSEVHADPRVDKSIFRIFRDTRFSKDKTRYKTHLGIWFWEGDGPRMECSGFYFHLDPPKLMLGVGIYMFPSHMIDEYRNSVVHEKYGKELTGIISRISKIPGCNIGRRHYKRLPRGFDPDHRNAELLMMNGFYGGIETTIPQELYTSGITDYCYDKYKPFLPLHKWIVGVTKRAKKTR